MKSKFLLAVAWLFIALATLNGKLAYADATMSPGAISQQVTCNDYWYEDSGCPDRFAVIQGKAAYGEPSGMGVESTRPLGAFCGAEGDDWNFNDRICHPSLAEGKAAFGAPTTTMRVLPAYCNVEGNDWNFNDPNCQR